MDTKLLKRLEILSQTTTLTLARLLGFLAKNLRSMKESVSSLEWMSAYLNLYPETRCSSIWAYLISSEKDNFLTY